MNGAYYTPKLVNLDIVEAWYTLQAALLAQQIAYKKAAQ